MQDFLWERVGNFISLNTEYPLPVRYTWQDDVKINDGLCHQGVYNGTFALLEPKMSPLSHVIERELKKIVKVRTLEGDMSNSPKCFLKSIFQTSLQES